MTKKLFYAVIVCSLFLLTPAPTAWAKTILYVPADDRPVSLECVVDTIEAVNFKVLTPPAEYLASRRRTGSPEKMWDWLADNASKADAMVLSADALVYGGLVDSRVHSWGSYVLQWRAKRFRQLQETNPQAQIYVFSTIMRSPQGTAGGVEPPYYETHGSDIFRLTALQDKAETRGLTADEQQTLQTLAETIPREYIVDWLQRREKNHHVNTKLIELTQAGYLNYLLIGRDDTSPFSQSNKELRMLSKLAAELPAGKYSSFPGADQLGMVLLARAYNELTMQQPVIEIRYALGAGAATVASYEDQPIGDTIREHITAAGGIVAGNSQTPDLLLAVNTPVTDRTYEAEVFGNLPMRTAAMAEFVTDIEEHIRAGKSVAVADVSFANGADNALLRELHDRSMLDQLHAYSGWNTASNTLGYAIGQGMMARGMSDEARKGLLAVRYLDDWAYQANVRKELYREVFYPDYSGAQYLNWREPEITADAEKRIRLFAGRYLWVEPDTIHVTFPWHRMFEIHVKIAESENKIQARGNDSQ